MVGNETGRCLPTAAVVVDVVPFGCFAEPTCLATGATPALLLLLCRPVASMSLERALRKLRRTTASRLKAPSGAATASRGELVALFADDDRRPLLLRVVELRLSAEGGDNVLPADEASGLMAVLANARPNVVGLRKRLTAAVDVDLDSAGFKADDATFCCCCWSALAVLAALLARTAALYACSDSCEADDLFERTELCMEPPSESTDRSTSEPAASAVRCCNVADAADRARPFVGPAGWPGDDVRLSRDSVGTGRAGAGADATTIRLLLASRDMHAELSLDDRFVRSTIGSTMATAGARGGP